MQLVQARAVVMGERGRWGRCRENQQVWIQWVPGHGGLRWHETVLQCHTSETKAIIENNEWIHLTGKIPGPAGRQIWTCAIMELAALGPAMSSTGDARPLQMWEDGLEGLWLCDRAREDAADRQHHLGAGWEMGGRWWKSGWGTDVWAESREQMGVGKKE